MEKNKPKTPVKEAPLMHSFNGNDKSTSSSSSAMKFIITFVVIALVGIGSGFALATVTKATGKQLLPVANLGPNLKGKTYGSDDIKTFKDTAEGTLKDGGINGEGQFHLVRPGGDSQNVYLTSSLVDLSQFLGRKVKVWGQTQSAQTAGWLMDVGRVEIE
jgi:hypothetical protein